MLHAKPLKMYLHYGYCASPSYPPHLYFSYNMVNNSTPEASQHACPTSRALWHQQYAYHSGRRASLLASRAPPLSASFAPVTYEQIAAPQPVPQYGNGMSYEFTPHAPYVYPMMSSVCDSHIQCAVPISNSVFVRGNCTGDFPEQLLCAACEQLQIQLAVPSAVGAAAAKQLARTRKPKLQLSTMGSTGTKQPAREPELVAAIARV
jgi:hypothetical protein